jgi:CDP-diglyceride synthetase
MMEEELIKIWQSSPNQERVKFEKSRLIIDVQSSMDKLHRAIKFRDWREQVAVIIVVPFFIAAVFFVPHIISKITSVAIVAWAIYVAVRLRNAKKHKPGAYSENYHDYLLKTRDYLRIQKRLLDSVIYWYILPGMTLTMLFTLGLVSESRNLSFLVKMAVGNVILAIVTYYLNKRAVQKEFVPRLAKVDELIKVMEQQ